MTAGLLGLLCAAAGCKGGTPDQKKAPPPFEVSVIKVAPRPVTVYDEYVAQTEATSTVEIRSQVTGLLERQVVADGAHVANGDLLYVIDPRPFQSALDQAQANLAQAQANLTNAQHQLQRYQGLVGQGFVSRQAYDTAVAQQQGGRAAVQAQRAAVRDAQINLGYTRIRAPGDGYLSQSQVRPGSLVTAQQTLLNTLYSSDPMYVYFTVSEDKLAGLQQSLKPAEAAAFAARDFQIQLPDGRRYSYPGRLNFVDAAVNEKTGTLQARVSVPNPERVLRPGMFVRLTVPAVQRNDAIVVPQMAVTELQGLKMVYVVGPDNKPQQREIVADTRAGNDWVVQKGLAPGDLVIVQGSQKVQMMPNAPVKPVLLAADQAPGAATAQATGPSPPPTSGAATTPANAGGPAGAPPGAGTIPATGAAPGRASVQPPAARPGRTPAQESQSPPAGGPTSPEAADAAASAATDAPGQDERTARGR